MARRGLRSAVVVVALLGALTWVSPAPAAAFGALASVGYHPAFGAFQVQTVGLQATGPAPGGNGTYTLALGEARSDPIPFDATLATFVAALGPMGFEVLEAHGGPDGLGPFLGRARFTLTFANDPGVPLAVVDNQTWRPDFGGVPGAVLTDCVYCLDVAPPTGAANGGVMIFLHGGLLVTGDRNVGVLEEYAQRARAAGWVTASANYRLTQYERGLGACDLDQPVLGTDPCSAWVRAADDAGADAQVAVAYFAQHASEYGIDPAKVVMTGGSAGGIVALHAAARSPEAIGRRPAAVVSIAGAMRDQLVAPGMPPVFFAAFTHDPGYAVFGMDVWEEGRELLGRARVTGNAVTIHGYAGYGHVPEPTLGTYPGVRDSRAEAEDLIPALLDFAADPTRSAGSQWFGQAAPFIASRPLGGPTLFTRADERRRPLVGDFNGDQRSDVLWYGEGAAADTLWFARPDGTFADPIERTNGTALGYVPFVDQPATYASVLVGDFDGNGRDDVLWWDAGRLELWRFGVRADGRPAITTPPALLPPLARPVVADVDGDGGDDILWWGPGLTPDALWWGRADGTFEAGPVGDPGSAFLRPTVTDLDGDGRADIYWRDPFGRGVLWLGGDRTSPFRAASPQESPDTSGTGDQIVSGDVDGDGRAELVVYGIGPRPDALWHLGRDGSGGLGATATPLTLGGAVDLRIADLDGDQRADLLLFTPGAAQLPVWRGGAAGTFTVTNLALGRSGTPLVGRFDGVVGGASIGRSDLFWY